MPLKSKEYGLTSLPTQGVLHEVLFSGLDREWHDRQRRVVSSAFSMTQMVKYEPWVNDNIALFINQLRTRFVTKGGPGATMDVMEWATYFSLDLIHEITFGERAGFIQEGRDVNGVIDGVHKMMAWTLYVSENTLRTRMQSYN